MECGAAAARRRGVVGVRRCDGAHVCRVVGERNQGSCSDPSGTSTSMETPAPEIQSWERSVAATPDRVATAMRGPTHRCALRERRTERCPIRTAGSLSDTRRHGEGDRGGLAIWDARWAARPLAAIDRGVARDHSIRGSVPACCRGLHAAGGCPAAGGGPRLRESGSRGVGGWRAGVGELGVPRSAEHRWLPRRSRTMAQAVIGVHTGHPLRQRIRILRGGDAVTVPLRCAPVQSLDATQLRLGVTAASGRADMMDWWRGPDGGTSSRRSARKYVSASQPITYLCGGPPQLTNAISRSAAPGVGPDPRPVGHPL